MSKTGLSCIGTLTVTLLIITFDDVVEPKIDLIA